MNKQKFTAWFKIYQSSQRQDMLALCHLCKGGNLISKNILKTERENEVCSFLSMTELKNITFGAWTLQK
jgi:hypothetical protein